MATDAEASTNLFSDCFVEEDVIVDDDIQNDTEQIEIIQPKQNGNENGHGNENGEERKAVVANEIAENTSSPRRSGRQRTTNKYVAKYIEQHKIEHEDAYIEVEVDTDEVAQTIPMTPIQFTVGTTQKGGLCIFHEGYRYTHNSRNSWRCWKKKCWATVHGAHKNEHGEMFGYLGERPHTHPPEPEQEIFKYGAGRKSRAKSINPANKSDPYPQPRVRHYPHLIQHKREIMDEKNTPTSHMVGTSSAASMMAEPPSPVQEMVVVDDDNNKSQPIRIIYTPADSTANASDNQQHQRYIAGGHLQQTTTTFLLDGITLTPGNVLIAVHGRAADNYGDNQLIRGKVICVGQSMCNFGHRSTAETMPKPGDEVWVRGRNGFPVDMGMGSGERKLFVFNIWDIAMKLNNF